MQGPDTLRYNKKSMAEFRELYGEIIEDRGSIGILIVDGSRGDSICDLCVMDNCRTRKTADDLSIWKGSGLVMQYTGLEFGKVYTSEEFRTRAEKLYTHRTPKAQPMQ